MKLNNNKYYKFINNKKYSKIFKKICNLYKNRVFNKIIIITYLILIMNIEEKKNRI